MKKTMTPENLIIRRQKNDQSDYQALADFYNYGYPEESATALSLKLFDESRPAHIVCERWFAEQNGVIIGFGGFEHWADFYHPDKYLLHLIVAPERQQQGIGSLLYHQLLEQLENRHPQSARIWVQEDRPESIRFAEKRGFAKIKLKWNIQLELKSWSIEPFSARLEKIEREEGIVVKSLAQINNDLENQRKLYDLYVMTLDNIATTDTAAIASFDEFTEQIGHSSDEFFLVAADKERYVGMWQLENKSSDSLYGGIMAVEADYRRRGAALALAVHGIARAKLFQYKTLVVHTDEHNRAILALTEKMGFTHLPAQIFFSKQFAD